VKRWWVPGLGWYLGRHPGDVASVARAAWRLRRTRWWRQPPWLPLPSVAYWEFRMSTINGVDGHLEPAAVVAAARWSVQQRVGR